jgi:hypothetical protein
MPASLCPRSRLLAGALASTLAVLCSAGCFNSPDLNNLRCTTSAHCQSGYTCVVPPGLCERTVDAGGRDLLVLFDGAVALDGTRGAVDSVGTTDLAAIVDASLVLDAGPDAPNAAGPEAAASLDTLSVSGPEVATDLPTASFIDSSAPDRTLDTTSDSPIVAVDLALPGPEVGPDLPSVKPRGAPCSLATECADGICADGYCCDSACKGTCQACDVANALGKCAPLGKGATPHAGHGACTASDVTCAGSCDGASGSCFYPPATTACGAASCTGTTYQPVGACNSAGACISGTSTSCGAFACGVSSCYSSCSSNSQCVSGAACVGGKCVVCSGGQTVCPNQCANLLTDNGHCGSCATACGSTEQCSAGACLLADGQSCTVGSDCAAGVCSKFYPDADADGYPVSGSSLSWCHVNTAKATGYVPARSDGKWDCYDGDANVHPGQTTFYLSQSPSYGWDYDCSGSIERRSEADVGDTCVLDGTGAACSIITAAGIPSSTYFNCGDEYSLPTQCSYLGGIQCNFMGSYPSGRFVACH